MLRTFVGSCKFLFKRSTRLKINPLNNLLKSTNKFYFSNRTNKNGSNLLKLSKAEQMSIGIMKYLNNKNKNNFQFSEICNQLSEYLKQLSECKELIEETNKIIKESNKEEQKSLKADIEFYKEENTNLMKSKI